MTIAEIIQIIGLIVLHTVIGFGPGIAIGFLVSNAIIGRDFNFHHDNAKQAGKDAATHNEQWHPDHERWQR